jgi:hypothetical protein
MTCACKSKDEIPALASAFIEINKNENFKTPKNTPTPKTFQTDVLGKGIKNTAGIATMKNLKEEKSIGGNSSNPNFITEKLTPQIKTTINANNVLFKFTLSP